MDPLDLGYLIVTGAATASRAPELASGLLELVPRLITILTPNTGRVVTARDLSAIEHNTVVDSYFDQAIVPRPPFGVVLVAPCTFNSLNKLAAAVADSLALSVVAEAIGRGHTGDRRAIGEPAAYGPPALRPLAGHAERLGGNRRALRGPRLRPTAWRPRRWS